MKQVTTSSSQERHQALEVNTVGAESLPKTLSQETATGEQPEDVVIDVRNVWKRFKLYHNPVTGPLKEWVFFWNRRQYFQEHVAIKNVSMQVCRGEVVGIIGPNGAGKTTLLKMIAGLLPIDEGQITVRGKVNALLALGVGVHPEFTGRENIAFGGMLLGMSKHEIAEKTDSIIDFAELGDFIDRPFRTYSSGMRARLLFSISMSVNPDILIIDEALATGDAYFVQKCLQRIRQICRSGATILFVSHNLTQVQSICDRALLMVDGRLETEGRPMEIVAAYNAWAFEKEAAKLPAQEAAIQLVGGNGKIVFESIQLKNQRGEQTNAFYTGDSLITEFSYQSSLPPGSSVVFFVGIVRATDGQWVGEINTSYHIDSLTGRVQQKDLRVNRTGTITVIMEPLLLLNNHYHLWVMVYDRSERYCEYRGIAPFFVARRAHVFDRDPVFWQPCQIMSDE